MTDFNSNNVWFTADHHFHHSSIIHHCNRPFFDVSEMNESLIERWNVTVPKRDHVFVVGDFSFGKSEDTLKILSRLNGHKYLVEGNHDRYNSQCRKKYMWVKDYYELKLKDLDNNSKQRIVLFHYPIESWNARHHGSWMLHGHSHSRTPSTEFQKRLDVGVDCWDYTPVSYKEVKEVMLKKKSFQDSEY